MEVIVDAAPQLTSLSLENMSIIEDEHIQILLRGLPHLTSLNLSMCTGLTDDVFYLSQDQLSELRPIRDDSILPGSNLATVDLSGCQKLTNTCIRHLLELCGPTLKSLNVSCTGMDCTLLWYLSGYSLSSTVQLALQSSKKQEEPYNGLALKQLLHTFNTLQKRLDEMKRGAMVDELEVASCAAGTHIHENVREGYENRESLGISETGPEVQVGGVDTSSFEAAGSSCCPSLEFSSTGTVVARNEQICTSDAATRSAMEECQDAAAGNSCFSSRAFSNGNTTSTVTKDKQIGTSGTAARSGTCLHASAGSSRSCHLATIDTAETRDYMEDHDAVVTSHLEALDVNEVNTEVLTSPVGGQSGFASDSDIAPNTQIATWSAANSGQDEEGTREDRIFCFEDISLEIESIEKTQGSDCTLNTNDSVRCGEASVTQDPLESDAYTLLNSSRSAELDTFNEETDKVHIKVDRNLNAEDPNTVSMHCHLCSHVKRSHRSSKMESMNGNPEPKGDLNEMGTVPIQPLIQVSGASEVSVSDQQESRCSSTNPNPGTALNSSFSELGNKDLRTVLGIECNLPCQDAVSFSGCVEDNRNSIATSAPLSDSFAESSKFVSCADTEKKVLPDSVSMPIEKCSFESLEFSAATTTVCCAVEIENLQLHDTVVSNSSQTAHAALCCVIKTTDNDSGGEGSSFLNDENTNMGNSASSVPSISETIENNDTKASRSSEYKEGFDSMLPANTQMLPRLFEPNMISLDISFTDLDHAVVASCLEDYFSVNQHLQKLVLSQKGLTNAMLEIISGNIKDLRYFGMYDCPEISNEGLASFLKGCPRLQHMDIQGLSHVGDQGIYPVFEHDDSRLNVIKLAETCITDITLNRIARTIGPKLQELVLLWCEDVTDAGLHKIALHCPSLKTLLLRQRTMHAETLQAFAENCPHLEDVGLSSVSCITGDLMESVATRLKRLQKLDVSWNSDLTNQAVSAILSSCPVLSELLLCGVKQITDKPFLSIIANYSKWKRCQILIQLKMREQKLRRDTGMAQLSSDEEFEDLYVPHRSTSYAPSLQVLNLSFCDHVNDNHLQEIVAVCRGTLNIVDYYGEDITPKLLHAL